MCIRVNTRCLSVLICSQAPKGDVMKTFEIHLPATLTVIINATSEYHAHKIALSKKGLTVEDASGFDGTILEGCQISVHETPTGNIHEIE